MFTLFKTAKISQSQARLTKKDLLELFYDQPDHAWISQDKYIKANFEDFFENVPTQILKDIVIKHQIIFAPILAKYSCAISSANVILVFPELHELLASTALSPYKAILAHEIGHIIYGHGAKSLSVIEAQVEADKLAVTLGFSEDLENFLLDQPESIEKRIRLSYLTARYYNKEV